MNNFRLFATAALLGASTFGIAATPASAAPCRDAKGHFAKCNGTNGPVAARSPATRAAPARTIAHAAAPAPARTAAVVHAASPVAARPAPKAAMTATKLAARPTAVVATMHSAKPAAPTAAHAVKPAKAPKVG